MDAMPERPQLLRICNSYYSQAPMCTNCPGRFFEFLPYRSYQISSCNILIPRVYVQVHLPVYDPDTLLLLTIFGDPSKKGLFSHGPPPLIGKLRIRLSTVAANQQHQCKLPMLAPRQKGGKRVAFAHVGLKVRPA